MRSEAARTIGRGYFFVVIGLLWYLVQGGWWTSARLSPYS